MPLSLTHGGLLDSDERGSRLLLVAVGAMQRRGVCLSLSHGGLLGSDERGSRLAVVLGAMKRRGLCLSLSESWRLDGK